MNVLVIGASRGIGLELARQYRVAGAQVTATARDAAGLTRLRALGATAFAIDVADVASAASLAWRIEGTAFDIAVLSAGVYGPHTTTPQAPTEADFDTVMHTNVLGPMRLLPQMADALAANARLAIISSRMGSIGLRENTAGGLYRASKAALNSVLKDTSLALQGRAICVAVHPGWVRTDMGGAGADLDVRDAVADLRRLLAALQPADNGGFFNHDGTALAW